ncbi:hypothetical protein [Oceanirhabdus seepicola]|uniref:TFIIB-type zinc ribbon-containing protein n=1 Tax=Oceanirhabdus seepicola TaxID=2828781 RepID=A0A9J6P8E7_9CLOT|nr:hypothetical protein [Oceanirhabdus seepicola]MCM1992859.1 hypothetical protein [Oceanirhabdus seepicola]
MNNFNQENTKVEKDTHKYDCPNCGGNLSFDIGTQSLICPYCSSNVQIEFEDEEIIEYDIDSAMMKAKTDWGDEQRTIKCENCGAETLVEAKNTSEFCAFCGSSHILKSDGEKTIVPESLIPFKITKENAQKEFKKWINKRYYAPRALKHQYNSDKLSGVYIPFWTYDSSTYSSYSAQKGTYYYVDVTEWVEQDGERKQVTKKERRTRWEYTAGDFSKDFDDILIPSSNQVKEKLLKRLEPFNLNELVRYQPHYISGFISERYSIDVDAGWNLAQTEIKSDLRNGIRRKINGDEVRDLRISTHYEDIKFKHILLPIWISAYTFKDKNYKFLINGQTGEVQGESPISILKIIFTILLLAGVAALIYFYMRNK